MSSSTARRSGQRAIFIFDASSKKTKRIIIDSEAILVEHAMAHMNKDSYVPYVFVQNTNMRKKPRLKVGIVCGYFDHDSNDWHIGLIAYQNLKYTFIARVKGIYEGEGRLKVSLIWLLMHRKFGEILKINII